MRYFFSAIAVPTLALAFLAPSARAATLGGYAGHALEARQEACFSESYGMVTNNMSSAPACSGGAVGGAPTWEVGLYVNSAGHYNVSVTTLCSLNTQCVAFSMYNDGLVFTQTGGAGGGTSEWQVGSDAYVPSGGYLYAACGIPANDCAWSSVNWQQTSN